MIEFISGFCVGMCIAFILMTLQELKDEKKNQQ
jgi:hypothetical protein